MRRVLLLSSILLSLSTPTAADVPGKSTRPQPRLVPTPGSNVPVGQLRISGNVYVGELAPDFSLTSAGGRDMALSHMRGNWVLLHFVSDRKDFAALEAAQPELERLGVTLVGVCKDNPQSLRGQAQRDNVSFELLADATGEVSAIYGLYDSGSFMSRPGLVVIDRTGMTRLSLMGSIPPRHLADLIRFAMLGVAEPEAITQSGAR